MSRKYKFCSICPICSGTELFHWHHGTGDYNNKFASANQTHYGNLYIYDDGTIECEVCHLKDIIYNWRFDCGKLAYNEVSRIGLIRMISIMGQMGNVDNGFIQNVLSNLK